MILAFVFFSSLSLQAQSPFSFNYDFRILNTDQSCNSSSNEAEFQVCYENSGGLFEIQINISDCDIDVTDEGDFELFENFSNGDDYMVYGGEFYPDALGCLTFKGILPPNSQGCPIQVDVYDINSLPKTLFSSNTFNVPTYSVIGAPNTNTLISSTGLTSGARHHIKVLGNLVFDNDFTFATGSDIIMSSADARLSVNLNRTLNLRGTYVHGCDDLTWDGIYVKPVGQLIMIESTIEDPTVAIDLDQSRFEGFLNEIYSNGTGINARNRSVLLSAGNRIIGTGSGDGIILNDSDLLMGGGQAILSRFDHEITNFTNGISARNSSNITSRLIFFNKIHGNDTGIELYEASSLIFVSPSNNEPSIYNNDVGIYAEQSNLVIQNTSLDNNSIYGIQWTAVNGSGVEVSNCSISNSGIGFVGSGGGSSITINDNRRIENSFFNDNFNDIVIASTEQFKEENQWTISNNSFQDATGFVSIYALNMGDSEIFNNSFAQVSNGAFISADNSDWTRAACNEFNGGSKYGILVTDSYEFEIECNENVFSSELGLQLEGNCDVSVIRGNTWHGTTYDMQYGSGTGNPFAISGEQPPSQYLQAHGNRFMKKEVLHNDNGNANFSTYWVDNASGPITELNPNRTPNNWFGNNLSFNNAYTCGNTCPTNPGPGLIPGITDREKDLINGLISYASNGQAIDFNTKEKIYHRIIELNDPANNSLQTTIENGSLVDEFYAVEQGIRDLLTLSSSEQTLLNNASNQYHQNAITLDSLLRDTAQDYSMYDPIIDALIQSMQDDRHTIDSVFAVRETALNAALSGYVTTLNQLTLNNSYEQNRATMLEVMIELFNTPYDELPAQMKSDITTISNLCPYEDGLAVYHARALRILNNEINPQYWGDNCSWNQSMPTSTEESLFVPELKVFPNPTKGFIQVALKNFGSDEIQCHITNHLGQTVYNKALQNNAEHRLDVSALPAGQYLLQVSDTEGELEQMKLTIQ